MLYISIELQSYCLYVLVALKRYSSFSIEASLKYFILGSFASSVYIFGASLVFGLTGTSSFACLIEIIPTLSNSTQLPLLLLLSFFFVFLGILFKLAVVPFHF